VALLPERRIIPDVTFKACLQVLRRVPRKAQRTEEDSDEQQTSLQFLLRGLIKLVPHPRDVQVHQELAADLIATGHFGQALRFLQDILGAGRPYMGNVRYHGVLGTLSSLLLLQHLDAEHEVGGAGDSSVLGSRGEARLKWKGDDVGEMEEEEDAEAGEAAAGVAAMNMSMSNMSTAAEDASSGTAFAAEASSFSKRVQLRRKNRMLVPCRSRSGDAPDDAVSTGERLDGGRIDTMSQCGGGEGGEGGKYDAGAVTRGSFAWCIGLGMRGGMERIRKGGGLEDFERACKELTRALQAERIDALSGHLVSVHCVAGRWEEAAHELLAHVRAQPLSVNGWRRLAEFRAALEEPPLMELVYGTLDSSGISAEEAQSQAATQPMDDTEEWRRVGMEETEREKRGEEQALAVLDMYPLPLAVDKWLTRDVAATRALCALRALVRRDRAPRKRLLVALGNALDVRQRDEHLLRALEEELAAATCVDIKEEADEWRSRRGWWPRYHGGTCSAVSVRLAQLLQELRALPEEKEEEEEE
jgi:hypothetical protein